MGVVYYPTTIPSFINWFLSLGSKWGLLSQQREFGSFELMNPLHIFLILSSSDIMASTSRLYPHSQLLAIKLGETLVLQFSCSLVSLNDGNNLVKNFFCVWSICTFLCSVWKQVRTIVNIPFCIKIVDSGVLLISLCNILNILSIPVNLKCFKYAWCAKFKASLRPWFVFFIWECIKLLVHILVCQTI
jgi:hypothetical protein